MQNNIIKIPKDATYDVPEGRFRARLKSVTPKFRYHQNKQIEQIRFTFEVDVPGLEHLKPLAGRTFDRSLDRRAELRSFVEQWKGSEWVQLQSKGQINFDLFIGDEVELELAHLQRPPHEKPFVLITAIRPLPEIKLREVKEAA